MKVNENLPRITQIISEVFQYGKDIPEEYALEGTRNHARCTAYDCGLDDDAPGGWIKFRAEFPDIEFTASEQPFDNGDFRGTADRIYKLAGLS